MLEAKAQVVITVVPSERVIHINFSIPLTDSLVKKFSDFIEQFNGIGWDTSYHSLSYGFKVFHKRAWDCNVVAYEIKTFLVAQGIPDVYTQVEKDQVLYKPL